MSQALGFYSLFAFMYTVYISTPNFLGLLVVVGNDADMSPKICKFTGKLHDGVESILNWQLHKLF